MDKPFNQSQETFNQSQETFNQSQETFNPIEIFRIESDTLIKKLGKGPRGNILNEYFEVPKKFTQGMLYFYFSHHVFDHFEEKLDTKIIFPRNQMKNFQLFLKQNYPDTSPFRFLYYLHQRYPEHCIIGIENGQGFHHFFKHDYGLYGDMLKNYYHFLELIVRLIGEKVDRGYDPLGELVASGLINNGQFYSFLTKELYDPRVLIIIHQFAFDPNKTRYLSASGEVIEEEIKQLQQDENNED
jgi:hypothetical protein